MKEPLPLVLASASPRRRELLGRLGVEVIPAPVDVDESPVNDEPPVAVPLRLAHAKAAAACERFPDLPVLAGDTVVVAEGRILGKPRTAQEARGMLEALRGRTHTVATAMVVHFRGKKSSSLDVVKVTFSPFPLSLLDWYLEGDEWRDKAGAYAVQGQAALFVERVEGNVQAVVGLPLARLPRLLAEVGLALKPEGSRLLLVPRSE